MSYGQTLDSASIIGEPIRLGNLLVAQNIFPNRMTLDDAVKACASLGPGWRLPDFGELSRIYPITDNSWNNEFVLWSYSLCDDGPENACPFSVTFFSVDGSASVSSKISNEYVRAVRFF